MRSSHLDECFDGEEQEFLLEMVEPHLAEAREVLTDLLAEDFDTVADLETNSEMAQRQQRRIKFLETLRECIGGE
jgi:hypothetical protein